MRTETEIQEARSFIVQQLLNPDLHREQKTLLSGMSVALQWASGIGGSTLERLLQGEPIQTESKGREG